MASFATRYRLLRRSRCRGRRNDYAVESCGNERKGKASIKRRGNEQRARRKEKEDRGRLSMDVRGTQVAAILACMFFVTSGS